MIESRIPSSRIGRLWQYSGLATSMAFGAIGETIRRAGGSNENSGSIMFSAGNMERLVAKLSKMRGAALKLGQMLSFQGLSQTSRQPSYTNRSRFENASRPDPECPPAGPRPRRLHASIPARQGPIRQPRSQLERLIFDL